MFGELICAGFRNPSFNILRRVPYGGICYNGISKLHYSVWINDKIRSQSVSDRLLVTTLDGFLHQFRSLDCISC